MGTSLSHKLVLVVIPSLIMSKIVTWEHGLFTLNGRNKHGAGSVMKMPRYFFHIQDGSMALDHKGTNLPGIAAAREEAIERLRQIIAQKVMIGLMTKSECIIVTDELGARVDMVTFYDAVAAFGPL